MRLSSVTWQWREARATFLACSEESPHKNIIHSHLRICIRADGRTGVAVPASLSHSRKITVDRAVKTPKKIQFPFIQ